MVARKMPELARSFDVHIQQLVAFRIIQMQINLAARAFGRGRVKPV
jgi:hypothetical protein